MKDDLLGIAPKGRDFVKEANERKADVLIVRSSAFLLSYKG